MLPSHQWLIATVGPRTNAPGTSHGQGARVVDETQRLIASFIDRLGDRVRLTDHGTEVEALRLRPEISASPLFDVAVRRRIEQLSRFEHAGFSKVLHVGRLAPPDGRLVIVSGAVQGWRLSDVLEAADDQRQSIHPHAVVFLLRQLLDAVSALHDVAPGISHGALGTERLVLTRDHRAVVTESVFGVALRHLPFSSPERLWQELRLAVADNEAQPFGRLTDLRQVGVIGLSLALGRQLRRDEPPPRLATIVQELPRIRSQRQAEPLGAPLCDWLARVLSPAGSAQWSAGAAQRELGAIVEADANLAFEPTGLAALMEQVDAYYAAEAEPIPEPAPVAAGRASWPSVAPTPSLSAPTRVERAPAPVEPAPVVVQTRRVEPAPVVVQAPRVEPTPVVVQTPRVESAPVVVRAPRVEPTPVVVETPRIEPAPIVVEAPHVDMAPVVVEAPHVEPTPIVVEAAHVESAPVVAAPPVDAEPSPVPSEPAPGASAPARIDPSAVAAGQASDPSAETDSRLPALAPAVPDGGEPRPDVLVDFAMRDEAPPDPETGSEVAACIDALPVENLDLEPAFLLPLAEAAPPAPPAPVARAEAAASSPDAPAPAWPPTERIARTPSSLPGHLLSLDMRPDPAVSDVITPLAAAVTASPARPSRAVDVDRPHRDALAARAAGSSRSILGIGDTSEMPEIVGRSGGKRGRMVAGLGAAAMVIVMVGGYPLLRSRSVIATAGTTSQPQRTSPVSEPPKPSAPVAPASAAPTMPAPRPATPAPAPAEAASGFVEVVCAVALDVSEGGRSLGSTGRPIRLPVGRHTLEFGRDEFGYRASQVVDVKEGRHEQIRPSLPNGQANFNAIPWAEVSVDGRSLGETPLGNVQLTIGSHDVTFRHPEFGEQTRTVVVTTGAVARLSIEFRK